MSNQNWEDGYENGYKIGLKEGLDTTWHKVNKDGYVKELTYEDGIEECAQRAEAYAYMSPNFNALAEELRAILRKAQEKC